MSAPKREGWSSNLGFIFATAGSAIGLGNIWKFPGKAGAGGGGAFLLVYALIVFTLGASVMLAELVLGRHTQRGTVGAFHSVAPRWTFLGAIGILCGFLVLSYYSVIGGWVLKYVTVYLAGGIAPDQAAATFAQFTAHPLQPLIFLLLFLGATALIVLRGISGGIERVSRVFMPVLLVLLLVLLVRSVTLPGAAEGLRFLTTFDFSRLTPPVLLSALGQALFSLSVGLGTTCTYASYLSRKENLAANTGLICLLDTAVAFLAAFMLIPAVFATGTPLGAGGTFAFVALPGVFAAIPGGGVFAALFYLLLAFAALTSSISILEALVTFGVETLRLSRRRATLCFVVLLALFGAIYSLSQGAVDLRGVWYSVRAGVTFPSLGAMLENLTDYLLIPLGSLGFCLFVGWIWGAEYAIAEVTQGGRFRFPLQRVWSVLIRYFAPAAILLILVLGFLGEITL